MESLAPNLFVKDINASIEFYKILGFNVQVTVPETGSDLVWAMMTNGSVTMMLQTMESLGGELPDISRQPGGSLLLYIQVKGIRELHEKIKNKVPVLTEIEKKFYGATEFSVKDPDNFVITFAEDE